MCVDKKNVWFPLDSTVHWHVIKSSSSSTQKGVKTNVLFFRKQMSLLECQFDDELDSKLEEKTEQKRKILNSRESSFNRSEGEPRKSDDDEMD